MSAHHWCPAAWQSPPQPPAPARPPRPRMHQAGAPPTMQSLTHNGSLPNREKVGQPIVQRQAHGCLFSCLALEPTLGSGQSWHVWSHSPPVLALSISISYFLVVTCHLERLWTRPATSNGLALASGWQKPQQLRPNALRNITAWIWMPSWYSCCALQLDK